MACMGDNTGQEAEAGATGVSVGVISTGASTGIYATGGSEEVKGVGCTEARMVVKIECVMVGAKDGDDVGKALCAGSTLGEAEGGKVGLSGYAT